MTRLIAFSLAATTACTSIAYAPGRSAEALEGLNVRGRRVINTDDGLKTVDSGTHLEFVMRDGTVHEGEFSGLHREGDNLKIVREGGHVLVLPLDSVDSVGVRFFSFGKTFWLSAAIVAGAALFVSAIDASQQTR